MNLDDPIRMEMPNISSEVAVMIRVTRFAFALIPTYQNRFIQCDLLAPFVFCEITSNEGDGKRN